MICSFVWFPVCTNLESKVTFARVLCKQRKDGRLWYSFLRSLQQMILYIHDTRQPFGVVQARVFGNDKRVRCFCHTYPRVVAHSGVRAPVRDAAQIYVGCIDGLSHATVGYILGRWHWCDVPWTRPRVPAVPGSIIDGTTEHPVCRTGNGHPWCIKTSYDK